MQSDKEEVLFIALALLYGDPTLRMTQDRAHDFVHAVKQLAGPRVNPDSCIDMIGVYERYNVWYAKQPKPE
jgi:hypothetical protein